MLQQHCNVPYDWKKHFRSPGVYGYSSSCYTSCWQIINWGNTPNESWWGKVCIRGCMVLLWMCHVYRTQCMQTACTISFYYAQIHHGGRLHSGPSPSKLAGSRDVGQSGCMAMASYSVNPIHIANFLRCTAQICMVFTWWTAGFTMMSMCCGRHYEAADLSSSGVWNLILILCSNLSLIQMAFDSFCRSKKKCCEFGSWGIWVTRMKKKRVKVCARRIAQCPRRCRQQFCIPLVVPRGKVHVSRKARDPLSCRQQLFRPLAVTPRWRVTTIRACVESITSNWDKRNGSVLLRAWVVPSANRPATTAVSREWKFRI